MMINMYFSWFRNLVEAYESYDYEDYVIDPQFLQPQYFDPNPAKRQYSIQILYDS